MNCPQKTLAAICALMMAALAGCAQGAAAPKALGSAQDEPQAKIRSRTELVIVPVTVRDAGGRLVPDLRQEEFRIFEDDAEQKIEVYSNEAFPLSAVVLIDNDLPKTAASQVNASLAAIAGGFSAQDEVFVCRYDHVFHEGKGFTSDNDQLLTELQRTELSNSPAVPPPGGPFADGPSINGQSPAGGPIDTGVTRTIKLKSSKAVDDAVYEAARLLKDRGRGRRKLIFLISDGVNGKNNAYKFDDVVKVLLSSDISVYGVGVGGAVFNRKFTVLSKYAKATGGDVYYAAKGDDLSDLYGQVTEEARNQYTLAYSPRGTDRTRDYHSIEVRVKRPGLNILTRRGYYTGAARPN